MRITPPVKYDGLPCSYVGVGCAYEDINKTNFTEPLPEGLRSDGWLKLEDMNRYIRHHLSIKKSVYYKRNKRITLRKFLATNTAKACVCVYGHFIYVNGNDYWSFFDNDFDKIVCIWYIKSNNDITFRQNI